MTFGHGETHPRLLDTRRPMVLVVLDGLGDRPLPELDGRTPAEAARTPVLDELARRGASGWHLPFGWGRAASSEVSHWSLFGYGEQHFPGRAVLEALGAGLPVPTGVAVLHAALRTSMVRDGAVWVTGRAAPGDEADAALLLAELGAGAGRAVGDVDVAGGAGRAHGAGAAAGVAARHDVRLRPLPRRGEALLELPSHSSGEVSDSDPILEHLHPWLRPVATGPGGQAPADDLCGFLLAARDALTASPVNAGRVARGLPPLDLLTTKWAGVRGPLPGFEQLVGVPGGAVTSSALYRGFARLLGLAELDLPSDPDLTADMTRRVRAAEELLAAGAAFVHVHSKAPDEAGHSKQPHAKRDALERLDAGLPGLLDLADRAVVAVTGDHATPSSGGVLHSGDPTPFVVVGGAVRPDSVAAFGETPAGTGSLGALRAADVLPLLCGAADRPAFLGARVGAFRTIAVPDAPEPMTP